MDRAQRRLGINDWQPLEGWSVKCMVVSAAQGQVDAVLKLCSPWLGAASFLMQAVIIWALRPISAGGCWFEGPGERCG